MKLTRIQKALATITVLFVIYWAALLASRQTASSLNLYFSFLVDFVPFIGGVAVIVGANAWQEEKGYLRKGMLFVGIGLLLWAFGGFIWSYYNLIAHVDVPYPSLADLGYAPSEFFYCIGAVYIARGAGADLGLKKPYAKLFAFLISVAMLAASYYILIVVGHQGSFVTASDPFIKMFLDIAYPVGDFVSLTLAVTLSGLYFSSLAPRYRAGIICILLGLVMLFSGDFAFSYTTARGTYYNGGISDLLFLLGTFLLSFGALGFGEIHLPSIEAAAK